MIIISASLTKAARRARTSRFTPLRAADNACTQRRNVLSVTRRVLTILGISMLLGACGSSTTQQVPDAPPSSAPASPSPTATATSWTMPDLVGSHLQSAQNQIQSLTDFAIIVTTSHDATGAGRLQVLDMNWKVCSQNIPPGSTIDSGTRIDFGVVKVEERCP